MRPDIKNLFQLGFHKLKSLFLSRSTGEVWWILSKLFLAWTYSVILRQLLLLILMSVATKLVTVRITRSRAPKYWADHEILKMIQMNSKKSSSGYSFNTMLKNSSDLFQPINAIDICLASSETDLDRNRVLWNGTGRAKKANTAQTVSRTLVRNHISDGHI